MIVSAQCRRSITRGLEARGNKMYATLFLCCVLFGQDPEQSPGDSLTSMNAQWRPILDGVAAEYDLTRATDNARLERQNWSVYKWARPGSQGGNYGDIYVWTNRGNAEAIACFWRAPVDNGKFVIYHEMHSLSPSVLKSSRPGPHQWTTKEGLQRRLVAGAPAPASTPVVRLRQMREMSRNFAAYSLSSRDERTELRLLPQPLFRYQSSNPSVVDGALFAFVCSVGTDPEIFLLLEASATENGPKWQYALVRFSHLNLYVRYKDRDIWEAIRDEQNPLSHNAARTYWLFSEPFDSKLLKPKAVDSQ